LRGEGHHFLRLVVRCCSRRLQPPCASAPECCPVAGRAWRLLACDQLRRSRCRHPRGRNGDDLSAPHPLDADPRIPGAENPGGVAPRSDAPGCTYDDSNPKQRRPLAAAPHGRGQQPRAGARADRHQRLHDAPSTCAPEGRQHEPSCVRRRHRGAAARDADGESGSGSDSNGSCH
jgi:hypothetical protein